VPGTSTSDALRDLAAEQPGAPALAGAHGDITRRRLDQATNRVAGWLLDRLGPGRHRIGVCTASGAGALAAVAGVARAGKIAVPLDPACPLLLLRAMAQDASLSLLLTDFSGFSGPVGPLARLGEVLGAPSSSRPASAFPPAPDGIARLGYVASSPLAMRAVAWPDGSVLRWTAAFTGSGLVGPGRRCGVMAAGSSPTGSERALAVVLAGATAVPLDLARDGPEALADLVSRLRVDTLLVPPSVLRRLLLVLRRRLPGTGLTGVLLTDEPARGSDVRLARWLFGPRVAVASFYAPPEAGVVAWGAAAGGVAWPAAGVLPAGWCLPDVEVSLLGQDGRPVPEGQEGQVAVWGEGLPSSYWARPAWTAHTWQSDDRGQAWCRTGDRGRWDTNGRLVVTGGPEGTAVVRGHRVDLAEVEEVASGLPGVESADVGVRTDELGSAHLVLRVRAAEPVEPGALLGQLAERVAPALVPDDVEVVRAPPVRLLPPRVIDLTARVLATG
jgi:acyl-coenzyme A synthetase/AMP-(fatty) acid ligase